MDVNFSRGNDSGNRQPLPDASQEHNERMKKFRLTHPPVEVEAPKVDKPPRLEFLSFPFVVAGQFYPN